MAGGALGCSRLSLMGENAEPRLVYTHLCYNKYHDKAALG